jgi:hypothetical protein
MGARHLRIVPVGELHWRWASLLFLEDEGNKVSDNVLLDEGEVQWASSTLVASRETADPCHGLRPEGSISCLWAQCEDDDHAHEPASTQSGKIKVSEASSQGVSTPSTTSLVRSVHAAGFSMAEVEGADELLQNTDARVKIMAGTTPPAMEPANRAARRLIKSFVDLSSGAWIGPLPKPQISPPLTLGDCPVKDCRTCSGDRHTSQSFQISNSVATVQAGESNAPNQLVLIQSGHSWALFHLSKALGHFLARKGTLPAAY